jgi:enoyl-[acyl-carrier protein] reductase I
MSILKGKKAVIIGLASTRSIAWGIANALKNQGADLAFNYQNEKLEERVKKMAQDLGSSVCLPMDVSSDDEIANFFSNLKDQFGTFDILIHSVAFAPSSQLEGSFTEVTDRDGFRIAHDVSSYSLTAVTKAAMPLLNENASILTLSYLGAVKAMPSYNVMGLAKASLEANVRFLAYDLGPKSIRVNGISAGPIKTLAASGIKGIKTMLDHMEQASPLRRNVTIEEVGNAAAFLASDMASGITGQVVYVDSGYSIVGMSLS